MLFLIDQGVLGYSRSYKSKDGKQEKVFDALEWLAAMYSYVPNKGEQMLFLQISIAFLRHLGGPFWTRLPSFPNFI